jgi:hypothetical protein
LVALAIAFALAGCSDATDRLVVATWWPLVDRVQVEVEFRAWLNDAGRNLVRQPVMLEWRLVGGWDDWQRELMRPHPPDVLLGGRRAALERLERSLRPIGVGNEGPKPWLLIRRGEIRLVDRSGQPAARVKRPSANAGKDGSGAISPGTAGSVTFDDPRVDPISRAWATSLLIPENFGAGYAQLVKCAGSQRRLGCRAGSARSAVLRGEAGLAPVWIAEPTGSRFDEARPRNGPPPGANPQDAPEAAVPPRLVEGAAIVASGRNQAMAGEFLRFLAATRTERLAGETTLPGTGDPALEELIADLVGATLVDAQDELWGAWAALDRAGKPETALTWMNEPPPWPPASIAALLARGDSNALGLMETVAREIVPDATVRADLIRSWLAPGRVLDGGLLAELAHAANGRLAAEPRFRAWLRAEWTVWARQRFRRVERLAMARKSSAAAGRTSAPARERSRTTP